MTLLANPGTGLGADVEHLRRRLAPIAAQLPFEPRVFVHGAPAGGEAIRQHYFDEGPRDGEALLFLHGNPTWSFMWRALVRAFSDAYRCVAPDHVGCGLSDKPRTYPYTLTRHIENLERLVDALGLERVTLVLHDWGGAIGMGFARRHPERIARLVITNTAAFRSSRIPLRIAVCRLPVFGSLAVRGFNAFAKAATFMAVERPLTPEVKRGYLLPYDTYDHRVATHEFVRDIPMGPSHPSWSELGAIEEALPRFADRPAQILWGERDWCFTPTFRERWERVFPQAEVVRFPDAGHYLTEDAGPALVDAVRGFLERNP